MKTNKPIKWQDIKIGQDYYIEQLSQDKFTKLGDLRIRLHKQGGTYHDFDIDVISKRRHYLWENRIVKFKSGCKHCKWISKTFPDAKEMTPREYWIMTEIFVYLHNGKDHCDG